MTIIKFVVKLNRIGGRAAEYVQRIDPVLLRTTNLELALVMGKFAAEDVIASLQGARCKPELISVQVTA